jgi:hypothetical protein
MEIRAGCEPPGTELIPSPTPKSELRTPGSRFGRPQERLGQISRQGADGPTEPGPPLALAAMASRLARTPKPIASLASSSIRHLSFGLGLYMSERGASRVRPKTPANTAQALDVLISTIRTISIRSLGGSIPNSLGSSPLSARRRNLSSA